MNEKDSAYAKCKAAKVGELINCPQCGKSFEKASYQQAFCSSRVRGNCKDAYWNERRAQRPETMVSNPVTPEAEPEGAMELLRECLPLLQTDLAQWEQVVVAIQQKGCRLPDGSFSGRLVTATDVQNAMDSRDRAKRRLLRVLEVVRG